jgi:hypothetical protein
MPDINGIPYVESGDLVSAYPTVSQDLAQEVSDQLALKLDSTDQKIKQVIIGTHSTQVSSTSASFADTGLTASITPSAATSQVLVIVSQAVSLTTSNNGAMSIKIVRGVTDVQTFLYAQYGNVAASVSWANYNSHIYLDSPATTSATTYKTQFAMPTAVSTTGYVQRASATSTMLLLEIGA